MNRNRYLKWSVFLGAVALVTTSSAPFKAPELEGRLEVECGQPGGHDIALPPEFTHPSAPLDLGDRAQNSERKNLFRLASWLSNNEAAGCTRLIITAPKTLAVGIQATGVDGKMRAMPMDPRENRLSGLIRVFQNGRPVAKAQVEIWITAGGQWQQGGQTPGHDHIKAGMAPTVQLVDFPTAGRDPRLLAVGQRLRGETNSQGEFRYGLQPGYRGGPERVWARWINAPAGADSSYGATMFVRFGNLIDFGIAHNFSAKRQPVASPEFPYVLVGWTTEHNFAHYIQPEIVGLFDQGLKRMWERDLSRQEQELSRRTPRDPKARWFLLNDMSLEYGGLFRVGKNAQCNDPNHVGIGHATHNLGVDIDMAPCYSNGATRVSGAGCGYSGTRILNVNLLKAVVEQEMRGQLLKHSGDGPNKVDHYHLRLPGRGVRAR